MIRPATEADLPALLMLYAELHPADAHAFYDSCGFEAVAEGYRRYFG